MVGHSVAQIEPAEPAISEVEMHFLAQAPFRADAEQVADKQHPEHQLRIDRGSTARAVARCQRLTHEAEVQHAVDAPEKVVGRHMIVEPETVEQRALRHLPTHHVHTPAAWQE